MSKKELDAIDPVDEVTEVPVSSDKAELKALFDKYAEQNPEKAAAKAEEFARKLS